MTRLPPPTSATSAHAPGVALPLAQPRAVRQPRTPRSAPRPEARGGGAPPSRLCSPKPEPLAATRRRTRRRRARRTARRRTGRAARRPRGGAARACSTARLADGDGRRPCSSHRPRRDQSGAAHEATRRRRSRAAAPTKASHSRRAAAASAPGRRRHDARLTRPRTWGTGGAWAARPEPAPAAAAAQPERVRSNCSLLSWTSSPRRGRARTTARAGRRRWAKTARWCSWSCSPSPGRRCGARLERVARRDGLAADHVGRRDALAKTRRSRPADVLAVLGRQPPVDALRLLAHGHVVRARRRRQKRAAATAAPGSGRLRPAGDRRHLRHRIPADRDRTAMYV